MTGMQRTLRYVAIPTEMAETVRSKGEDPAYRHPAHTQTATGHGPCRHCLRYFKVGKERRIMFTYDPFEGLEPLPLPGPIFIHEQPCPQYPTDGGFPEDLRGHPLTLVAYSVALSLLAGFVTAAVKGGSPMGAVWSLAGLQLALGVFFEVTSWALLPVWYHLVFLALIVPAVVWGGRLRVGWDSPG